MVLKLSLPKGKVVWALAHPISRNYIHENSGVGYQECQLIVTEKYQPVEVILEDYPKWAQVQIKTGIHLGQIINTGDSIIKQVPKEKVEAKNDTTTEVEEPKKVTKKKAVRKKTKRSNNKNE